MARLAVWGAPIGWHRDAPGFDVVAGVSLLKECTMQFRPWPVQKLAAKPARPLRHIPPVKERRLSIAFRTLRIRKAEPAHLIQDIC
jgi:hypothetical protein